MDSIVISDGLLKEIGNIKQAPFNYGAVTKLHINGIPYETGTGLLGQRELKGFLESFKYYSVNLFCPSACSGHIYKILVGFVVFFSQTEKSILHGSITPPPPWFSAQVHADE